MKPPRLLGAFMLAASCCLLACASASPSPVTESAPEDLVSRPAATPEMPSGGVLDANRKPKPALERLIELRRVAAGEILIDPRFAEAFNNLGVLLRERGALADATPILERAVALDPDLTAARFNLGLCYEDQGRREDAEREYLITIEQLPGDPVPRINLAMMYLDMERAQDAAAQLRAARPSVRGDVLLSIAVGEGLRRAGAPADAVAVLESALEDAGEYPPTDLLAELSLAYYAVGDLDSAERAMRRAIGQDEIDPALHYAYGSILAKQGKLGKARSHFRRAISLDPDGPYAERARRRLDSLK